MKLAQYLQKQIESDVTAFKAGIKQYGPLCYYKWSSHSVSAPRFGQWALDNSTSLLVGWSPRWINPYDQTYNQLLNPILTSFKTLVGHDGTSVPCFVCLTQFQPLQRPPTEGQAHIVGIPTEMARQRTYLDKSQRRLTEILMERGQCVDIVLSKYCEGTQWHVITELVTFLKTMPSWQLLIKTSKKVPFLN